MSDKEANRSNKAYDHPIISIGTENSQFLDLKPSGNGLYLPLATGVYGWNQSAFMEGLKQITVDFKKSKKKTGTNTPAKKFRFALVGIPAALKSGDGSEDTHFESEEDLKKRNETVYKWKEAIYSFYESIFQTDQDRECSKVASLNFATFAVVAISGKSVEQSFFLDNELPKQVDKFEVLSSLTFTVCGDYNAQVLWLGTSRVKPEPHQLEGLPRVRGKKVVIQTWIGRGFATLLVVALMKHIVYCTNMQEKIETSKSIKAAGPEIYLQCSTDDLTEGSAREFYLNLGFRPCIVNDNPDVVCIENDGPTQQIQSMTSYQNNDMNLRNQLPTCLKTTARPSLGTWIEPSECVMELLHLAFGQFKRRDALPATYCPPAPLRLQEIQYVVWPPLYCHSNEHLRLCSKHLSYLDWNSIDSPISGPAISKSIEYADCIKSVGVAP